MDSMVLTVIGGGSVNWMRGLMRDVYMLEGVSSGEIRLVDPNLEYARSVADMLRAFNRMKNKEYKISVTDDRREALAGADFVMTTFSPGSMEAFSNDLEIPIKYGIRLPVSMTVGIPGISAALRTVPVAHEIVEDMERLCPGAWLLNVTNPMTAVVTAMNMAASATRVIGLCHEFHAFERYMGAMFGLVRPSGVSTPDYLYKWLPEQGLDYAVAGINHFIWLTKASLNGRDLLPDVREYCRKNDAFLTEGGSGSGGVQATALYNHADEAKIALCRHFGYLPLAGDRHLIEFYPSLCNLRNGFGMKYGVRKTTVDERRLTIRDNLDTIRKIANGTEAVTWSGSGEEMTEIMRAIITGGSTPAIVNAPNAGQIANMPKGAVVETLADVSGDGIAPRSSGELPGAIGSLCRLHADVQGMTVMAALNGDRRLLVEAMSLDPSGGGADFREIPAMMDELLLANRRWLPRFFA